MNRFIGLFGCLLMLIFGCREEEFPFPGYPRVETHSIAIMGETSVAFSGAITFHKNFKILDHGFIWGDKDDLSLELSEKFSKGSAEGSLDFGFVLDRGMVKDKMYHVKAYAVTDTHTVYGNLETFVSPGSNSPIILDFSPRVGVWGDTIRISGKHFNQRPENNKVTFGQAEAEIINSSDSLIYCLVPTFSSYPTASIAVQTAGMLAKAPEVFKFSAPELLSFSPTTGIFGDTLILEGLNLGYYLHHLKVYFEEHPAKLVSLEQNRLKVIVPEEISVKESKISLQFVESHLVFNDYFTLIPPKLLALEKTSSFTNTGLKIYGENFNPLTHQNKLYFGNTEVEILNSGTDFLEFRMPTRRHYRNRTDNFTVEIAEQSNTLDISFQLLDPWLRIADFPFSGEKVNMAVGFSAYGKGYVGLGEENSEIFWEYDPMMDTWNKSVTFPGKNRSLAAHFSLGEFVYIGLGYNYPFDYFQDFWKFNPITKRFSAIKPFPFGSYTGIGLSTRGRAFLIIPREEQNFWEYDPVKDDWINLGNRGLPKYPETGFVIDDRMFVYVLDPFEEINRLYEYDFNLKVWLPKAELWDGESHEGSNAFVINGKAFLRTYRSLYRYDPIQDFWEKRAFKDPDFRNYAVSFVINQKVYLGTAGSLINVNDFWEYDPAYDVD